MKCIVCLRKHLALFKSYGNEVLNGHGEDSSNPDHRIDLEGEITNAEYHASKIDEEICLKIRHFRRCLIQKKFNINKNDLDIVEAIYYYLDSLEGLQVNEKYINIFSNIEMAPKSSDITKIDNICGCQSNKES